LIDSTEQDDIIDGLRHEKLDLTDLHTLYSKLYILSHDELGSDDEFRVVHVRERERENSLNQVIISGGLDSLNTAAKVPSVSLRNKHSLLLNI